MTRRELLRLGLAGGAAFAAPLRGMGAFIDDGGPLVVLGANRVPDDQLPSPPTRAFVEPLPVMTVLRPFSDPASLTGGPIDPTRFAELTRFGTPKYYEFFEREFAHKFHPDYAPSTLRGLGASYPGGTIRARYGEPVLVRVHNALPLTSAIPFGSSSTSTHLHNGHTPSDSDGFPTDIIGPGEFRDYVYPNVCAGFTTRVHPDTGDPLEALGTLWLHDETLSAGVANTYAGLAGVYSLFDDLDTGEDGTGLRLPSGDFDIPLVFADKAFDATCALVFDDDEGDGMLGDKWTVNGSIQPFLTVSRRRYRFRLLDAGPSRWWEFHLSDDSLMFQIAEDGNLLNNALGQRAIRLAPGERADVVIDFSQYPPGTVLELQNRLQQSSGRGPTGRLLNPGDRVLQFVVSGPAVADDSVDVSRDAKLRDVLPVNLFLGEVVTSRTFRFQRSDTDGWLINGQSFDPNRIDAHVKSGTAELWTLQNSSGSASHAVHVHCEECRVVSRNGLPPPPNEQFARKDVIKLGPKETVTVFMRFRDWTGPYTMESMAHRDNGAMMRWDLDS